MKLKKQKMTGVKVLLIAFFAVAVLLPLIRMLFLMADVDVGALFSSEGFITALGNSLLVSLVSTLVSVGLATALAYCIARSAIRCKGLFTILFTLPMLIPSISHGMGLVVLFGSNGVLTNLLHLGGDIYGFWGIVIGSVMYSFPVAFLMISDMLRYEDSTPYEAASVLGISKARQLGVISFPYLRKPMISVVFAVFTLIITDYGVPLMIGGQFTTLPVMMYQDVVGLLEFGKGSVIGLVLLVPAFIAFILDLADKGKASSTFITRSFNIVKNKFRDAMAYISCSVVSVAILLPIVAFCILTFVTKYPIDMTLTFNNVVRTMNIGADRYLMNSIIIALFVSIIGVAIAYITAYITARMSSKSSKALHLISIITLAVPGLVLGLSYVLFFNGTFIYGTLAILILVNIMHFFASPYLMIYNTFGKLNQNLEAVGQTLGISRGRIVLDVLIPQSRGTIAEMFAYFFVNSMMTISAVAFLSTLTTQPLSLMITMFEAQSLLECAAFVSILILAVNLILKGLVGLYKRNLKKRGFV
ncbi:MAG: ABC transporter permease subunit [Christensenella sp.]